MSSVHRSQSQLRQLYQAIDKDIHLSNMASMIELTIKGVKWSVAQYKQRKADRELRLNGNPIEVLDPSHEFHAVLPPMPYSAELEYNAQSPPHEIGSSLHLSNSSSSSLYSTSTIEAEADLENDIEFQQFMKWQRQMYLQRQRARGKLGVDESVQPPTYDFVMTQECPVDGGPSSRAGSVDSRDQMHLDLNQNDIGLLTPSVPAYSGVVELDGAAFVQQRSKTPVGVSELPATVSRRPRRRHIVELPGMSI